VGPNKIPYIVTHDGRTIRYPHPDIEVNDTIKYDLLKNEVIDHAKFENGNIAYCIGGNNIGRIGVLVGRDRHLGSFDIVHVRDARGKTFATRLNNIFIVGKGKKAWISFAKDNGIYLNALEIKQDVERKASKQ
jgi:small subunit ribosomal protein S4e